MVQELLVLPVETEKLVCLLLFDCCFVRSGLMESLLNCLVEYVYNVLVASKYLKVVPLFSY